MDSIVIVCICILGIVIAFIMINVLKSIKKQYYKKTSISVESKEIV